MSARFFEVDNLARAINYGLNKVRFTATVPAGSRLRLRQTLKSAEKRADGAIPMVPDSGMEMDGHARPAMVAGTVRLRRSEERRVGKECVRTCRSLGQPYQ